MNHEWKVGDYFRFGFDIRMNNLYLYKIVEMNHEEDYVLMLEILRGIKSHYTYGNFLIQAIYVSNNDAMRLALES